MVKGLDAHVPRFAQDPTQNKGGEKNQASTF